MNAHAPHFHDWPLAEQSRFVRQGPHEWHVQDLGEGPTLLFLHGAGGATHSWRDMLPLLADRWRCVALDLPGQGFTTSKSLVKTSRRGMSADIRALIVQEGWELSGLVGHSAGAVLALDLALSLPGALPTVGINAALSRFEGVAGWLFPLIARLLAVSPFVGPLFAMGTHPEIRARRLIAGTGSTLDDRGLALYGRLLSSSKHVDATLQMMARWEVDTLLEELPGLESQVLLLAAEGDKAVPPEVSQGAIHRIPHGELGLIPKLGHLAHEEAPAEVAALIDGFLRRVTS